MQRSIARRALVLAAAALPALCLAQTDGEPKFPPLMKIVVPFSAGASNDAIARVIAPLLAAQLGTTVIVENRPGATGMIGADFVAKSPPDGSVLLLTSSSFLTAAATQSRQPYDALTSFTPVSMIGNGPMVLAVGASTPFKSATDLVSAAKAKPGVITFGTAGAGSIAHLATEMFSDAAKIKMMHIPYKGAANALLDMAGGQIDLMISNYSSIAPQIHAGKVQPLAITSAHLNPVFPDLPPLANVAPGFTAENWVAVFVPAATPAPMVTRLNQVLNQIAATPEVKAILEPDGALPEAMTTSQLAARVKDDLQMWKKIAVDKKIFIE